MSVGVEGEWYKAARAACLPTAVFAKGDTRAATAVMEDKSLLAVGKCFFEVTKECLGDKTMTFEGVAFGHIDQRDVRFCNFNGRVRHGDNGAFGGGSCVIVGYEGRSAA